MLEKVIDVDPLDALQMIDDLQRLGVFYHFKDEIEKALEKIYNTNDKCNNEDLHSIALKFRVLRQHWYNVPQAYIAIEIVLKRYIHKYPRTVIRGPNRLQEQMDHINWLVRESDITCIEQLRMDRRCFMTLCHMVRTIGGLGHSKHVTLEEKMALFLYVLAHDLKSNRRGINCSKFHQVNDHRKFYKKNDNKKRPRGNDDVVEGLSMIANKLGEVFSATNEKLDFIGRRMGYEHDLASKRASLNDELIKLPITLNERLDACEIISQSAQKLDMFFSLTHDDKLR
ncbi:hypothetical protein LOK49_LG12G02321 [Camellia lanceoleosa]|uniref:Uncharacterized protein n=1 Tax=Camellia lanceoleosa TaxID=1840588 RepID=A0ACC0G0J7_9ERIC|nr:hypothetical protein LOK49_LG12G02321 [Camellia lanceoleosa]